MRMPNYYELDEPKRYTCDCKLVEEKKKLNAEAIEWKVRFETLRDRCRGLVGETNVWTMQDKLKIIIQKA